MPLREKCDDSSISFNIRELVSAWEESGAINGDKIPTRREAVRRATAIALSMCSKSEKSSESFNESLEQLGESPTEWRKHLDESYGKDTVDEYLKKKEE